MIVAIAEVSAKPGRMDDFKAWMKQSNKVISKFDGFISRRLLQAEDGSLRVMVEFESAEQFDTMRQSPEHQRVHKEAMSLRDVRSPPKIYTVAAQ